MRAVVNFWGCTYNVTAKDEAELKSRAEELAKERVTIVSYYVVEDGKARLLGAVGPSSARLVEPSSSPPAKTAPAPAKAAKPVAAPRTEQLGLVE